MSQAPRRKQPKAELLAPRVNPYISLRDLNVWSMDTMMRAKDSGLASRFRRQKNLRTVRYRNEEALARLKLTVLRFSEKMKRLPELLLD
jgi:hypothetical protein